MDLLYDSRIEGDFEGWNGEKIFALVNGTKWKQKYYRYRYHYHYRPIARVFQDGNSYFLEVDCMDEKIEVIRIT